MLKNYFKIAYRNLLKNKVFSLVNIFGLAIGMSACFFIFLYIHFEQSYDRFHHNAGRLYRVPLTFTGSLSNAGTMAANHPSLGPTLKAEFPEIENYTRVAPASLFNNASMLSYTTAGKTVTFDEEKTYFADAAFFTLFSFPFIEGDPASALSNARSIAISRSTARKYFGDEDPLGKTLILNAQMPYKVTGVFADVPENSHLKFNVLFSFSTLNQGMSVDHDDWIFPEFYTYVLLAPGADPKKVDEKLPAFINKHMGALMKQLDYGAQMHLQPVTDIHLRSNYSKEAEANGSEKEVGFLSLIGIFILVIAWINYINLSTAKSVERAKEVGLRKVIGAARIQLIAQFLMESFIINLLALAIATILILICFPYFGGFTGSPISTGFIASGLLSQSTFWLVLTGAFVAGTFLVGAYPAFILSAFKPALAVKGKLFQSAKGILLRKTLVSFQFILSLLLIAGTITVFSQLSYMQHQALGYNKDQLIVLNAPEIYDSAAYADKMGALKNELLRNPSVSGVSTSTEVPGRALLWQNSARKVSEDQTHNFIPYQVGIDENFVTNFQMKMAAGRNFYPNERWNTSGTEKAKIIINEQLLKGLGYKNAEAAINQDIVWRFGPRDIPGTIIGVLKDYHQRSLQQPFDPILYYYPDFNYWRFISVRIKADQPARDLASIENAYKTIFPGNAFKYFFLDEYFNQQYQSEQRFGKVFSLFTGLAIFVACLGLLGLSSFVIRVRTREIGIRKVLGASVFSLLALFSKDFVRLVIVASFIALPIIYLSANRWLDNYAFHIRLSWLIFVAPPVFLMSLALVTICLQSLKASLSNPIRNLRTD
jgi:putative ABC transport system permease protein